MKTIKQIAEETGKSKTAIRQKIEKLNLQTFRKDSANLLLLDSKQEKLILQAFKESDKKRVSANFPQKNNDLVSAMISTLQAQLDVKDEQIRQLTENNRALTEALTASQALHAGTMRKQLTGRRNFITRLFTKDKAGRDE